MTRAALAAATPCRASARPETARASAPAWKLPLGRTCAVRRDHERVVAGRRELDLDRRPRAVRAPPARSRAPRRGSGTTAGPAAGGRRPAAPGRCRRAARAGGPPPRPGPPPAAPPRRGGRAARARRRTPPGSAPPSRRRGAAPRPRRARAARPSRRRRRWWRPAPGRPWAPAQARRRAAARRARAARGRSCRPSRCPARGGAASAASSPASASAVSGRDPRAARGQPRQAGAERGPDDVVRQRRPDGRGAGADHDVLARRVGRRRLAAARTEPARRPVDRRAGGDGGVEGGAPGAEPGARLVVRARPGPARARRARRPRSRPRLPAARRAPCARKGTGAALTGRRRARAAPEDQAVVVGVDVRALVIDRLRESKNTARTGLPSAPNCTSMSRLAGDAFGRMISRSLARNQNFPFFIQLPDSACGLCSGLRHAGLSLTLQCPVGSGAAHEVGDRDDVHVAHDAAEGARCRRSRSTFTTHSSGSRPPCRCGCASSRVQLHADLSSARAACQRRVDRGSRSS